MCSHIRGLISAHNFFVLKLFTPHQPVEQPCYYIHPGFRSQVLQCIFLFLKTIFSYVVSNGLNLVGLNFMFVFLPNSQLILLSNQPDEVNL